MGFLSEDPTYLAGGLGVLAAAFLVALRVSQQGKFLVWALTALGLAGLVLVVEHFWVTDNERIERVVYDLRRAVANSDSPGVLTLLTPDAQFVQSGQVLSGDVTRNYIRTHLAAARFDFVRVVRLEANAGRQSGRGSAVFRIAASGSYTPPFTAVAYNFGTTNLDFSLGFRQTSPQVWRVDRITLTRVPRDMPAAGEMPVGPGSRRRSRLPRAL